MRILSLAPLSGPGLDLLRSLGDVEIDPWNEQTPLRLHSPPELIDRCEKVDILIIEADHVPRSVFEAVSLRALGVCRGEPSNVDLDAATERGVAVIRTPGRNADAVAELALGFMFGLLRSIVAADDDVRAGRFIDEGTIPQQRYLGRELASCTVGLVGFGAVARALATRLRALGVRALTYDPFVDPAEARAHGVEPVASLADLFASSDIISVHAPLTAETRGMIGAAEIAHARPGAYLVNTARYGLVAEEPLLAALRDGRLRGAAFDHFENEILSPDHPLVSMRNVILTPHIGGSTEQTTENHTRIVAEGLRDILDGRRPSTLANPDALVAGP